jgi:hypothetical protein
MTRRPMARLRVPRREWVGARRVRGAGGAGRRGRLAGVPDLHAGVDGQAASEKGAELAQKLGQLQPFIAVFPQEC